MKIEDSVVIVTGASSGIGLETAKLLSDQGAKVAVVARSTQALEELSDTLPQSFAYTADMSDYGAIHQMVQTVQTHYGRIDGLVNNAGLAYEANIDQIDPRMLDTIFRLNVFSCVVAMQEVLPVMKKQGSGAIVNVNSGTSFMRLPGYSVYSSSKRALMGFTLTAREEFAPYGIKVSSVYPGKTDTNFGKNKVAADPIAGASGNGPVRDYTDGEPAINVAALIVKALGEGDAEYFSLDRFRTLENR